MDAGDYFRESKSPGSGELITHFQLVPGVTNAWSYTSILP